MFKKKSRDSCLGCENADNSKGAHGDVGHGAHEHVDEDREEGRVDPHHWVHSSQHGVSHALKPRTCTTISVTCERFYFKAVKGIFSFKGTVLRDRFRKC
jgi:hypothetical protein